MCELVELAEDIHQRVLRGKTVEGTVYCEIGRYVLGQGTPVKRVFCFLGEEVIRTATYDTTCEAKDCGLSDGVNNLAHLTRCSVNSRLEGNTVRVSIHS
ncbi:hypothetical protein ACFL0X_02350 [Nanoarchaeota archaeon]